MDHNKPKRMQDTAESRRDERWHLAKNATEIRTTELEFALIRAFEGFLRWQAECVGAVSDLAVTGSENALLHIIAMHDRPKTVRDLARLTNRADIPNIQYSLRKLLSAELILRKGTGRAGVTYQTTEKGRQICMEYADLRSQNLTSMIGNLKGFPEKLADATRTLNILIGVYEEAARTTATHRRWD